jgi:hypothetical protein
MTELLDHAPAIDLGTGVVVEKQSPRGDISRERYFVSKIKGVDMRLGSIARGGRSISITAETLSRGRNRRGDIAYMVLPAPK